MSQSKLLLTYQMGYCGQVIDLAALTPSHRLAFCLGVGHAATGMLPWRTGVEVRKALSLYKIGDVVQQISRKGDRTKKCRACDTLGASFKVVDFYRDGNSEVLLIGRECKTFDNLTTITPIGCVDAVDFQLKRTTTAHPTFKVGDFVQQISRKGNGSKSCRACDRPEELYEVMDMNLDGEMLLIGLRLRFHEDEDEPMIVAVGWMEATDFCLKDVRNLAVVPFHLKGT